jgi:hypothetical protein
MVGAGFSMNSTQLPDGSVAIFPVIFGFCCLGLCAVGIVTVLGSENRKPYEYSLPTGVLVFLLGLVGIPICYESGGQVEGSQRLFMVLGVFWCLGFCAAGISLIRNNLKRRRAKELEEGHSDSGDASS